MAEQSKSKALYAFEQKLIYFYDDIEMMDVIRTSVIRGDLSSDQSKFLLKGVDKDKHAHLARRANAKGGRVNTINHLRGSVYSSFIKDLYEEVTDYLKVILLQASKNNFDSGRIIGEHGFKIDSKHVLSLGGWPQVCQYITESVFQALESERSTLNLLKKMCAKLGLNVEEKHFDAALPYLEVRHFLVHADGRLSEEYRAKYPVIKHKSGMVVLDYDFIVLAYKSVLTLVKEFDKEVVDKRLLMATDLR